MDKKMRESMDAVFKELSAMPREEFIKVMEACGEGIFTAEMFEPVPFSEGLCAVLTYKDRGYKGVGGQTVGADGSGEYAVIFDAETAEKAGEAAAKYIREIDRAHPGRISEVHLVYGEGYMGPFVKRISA